MKSFVPKWDLCQLEKKKKRRDRKDTCSDKMKDSTGGKINPFWEEREVAGRVKRERCYRLKLLCLTDKVQIINSVSKWIHKSSLHTGSSKRHSGPMRIQQFNNPPPPAEVSLGNKCCWPWTLTDFCEFVLLKYNFDILVLILLLQKEIL